MYQKAFGHIVLPKQIFPAVPKNELLIALPFSGKHLQNTFVKISQQDQSYFSV